MFALFANCCCRRADLKQSSSSAWHLRSCFHSAPVSLAFAAVTEYVSSAAAVRVVVVVFACLRGVARLTHEAAATSTTFYCFSSFTFLFRRLFFVLWRVAETLHALLQNSPTAVALAFQRCVRCMIAVRVESNVIRGLIFQRDWAIPAAPRLNC